MKTTFLLASLAVIALVPARVRAQESGGPKAGGTPAAASGASATPDQPGTPAATSPNGPTAQTTTSTGEPEAFVDRDGDGIQDGQEHRFRKHWKRRAAKGSLEGDEAGHHGPVRSGPGGGKGPGNGGRP